jgi:hypothetical protein
METTKTWRYGAMALALTIGASAAANATTLVRASVEDLAAGNETIVVGEVLGASSYWNWEGTFVLTDVRVAPTEVLKGRVEGRELTVTVLGGSVDGHTLVVVGGPDLVPGRSYVLFLGPEELPGVQTVETVRYLSQGAFDLQEGEDGVVNAVSQAKDLPLRPDRVGRTEVAGGPDGIPLAEMKDQVRKALKRGASPQEVKK